MKIDLLRIEDRLKAFFEKDLQIVSNKDPLQQLSEQIIACMEKNIHQTAGKLYAPNIYRISIKEKRLADELDLKEWKKHIQEIMKEIARDNSLRLAGPLHIQIFPNSNLQEDFEITVSNSAIPSGKTMNIYHADKEEAKQTPCLHAYLILTDESYFPIEKTVTHIGRREDNDLVIDNLRVSRIHAQIRQLEERHVLFDLDSASGTKVNGVKVRQHALNPGDVIEISDVPLIYGIDGESGADLNKPSKTRTFSTNKAEKTAK